MSADAAPAYMPAADVYECEGAIVVRLALPGVIEEDIDVSFPPGAVLVRGEVLPPVMPGPARAVLAEWRYGYFERAIELPARVDAETVSVRFEAGVLELTLRRL